MNISIFSAPFEIKHAWAIVEEASQLKTVPLVIIQNLHNLSLSIKIRLHVWGHSPSPRDSQWAATSACDAMLGLVGGGGAGRPGLIEWMGEVLVHRVLLIPNNHLRRGGGAFSPEEWTEYMIIKSSQSDIQYIGFSVMMK